MLKALMTGALGALMIATPLFAQGVDATGEDRGEVRRISTHMGQMTASFYLELEDEEPDGNLQFEPWQMLDDLFRDDVVFLMRHGPTDWSKRDIENVAPTDCSNQRIMTSFGMARMRELGTLLTANDIRFGEIVTSEWCRNRQTLDNLMIGMQRVDPEYADAVDVEIDSNVNLLLSLQGARTAEPLRERISAWEGSEDGPLLIISHFTNIDEVTDFHVYEGEMLVIDPKRENRVLGYLRLRSAEPDVGHFNVSD
ncbi:histidine phosphatase family protein [Roseobacter sp. HKCCA0434]|uniref:histidine phosphatase family protein n=1 Tax=Roseobacter sp. HKCCA0434 TaxID=3079297 RepID=UPI002905D8CA|nr:histidine phosphatase family protein [Roseobacter sp. HKCCA0434]